MQRISAAWFADFGTAMVPIMGTSPTPLTIEDLNRIYGFLLLMRDEKTYPFDLKASRGWINETNTLIEQVLNEPIATQPAKLAAMKPAIQQAGNRVAMILGGELAVLPIYHLWPIRAYNLEVLVSQGENVFSEIARKDFTEDEIHNFREGGKCLAFQVPTAAAFHIFRGAESVIRRYYEAVIGQLPKHKMRNWGAYIKHLRRSGADVKVIAILEQIKDLHRNPVIHPEAQLSNDDAQSLIGIMDSAITAMVVEMKERREKTSPALPFNQPQILPPVSGTTS
jgi:hypothetical protein